jgi:type I restriction enzyme S subunit
MTKKTNLPELRFPEFRDEWEDKRLGNEISFLAGYAFDSKDMMTEPSNYQLLKMSNVYQNELRLDRNPSFWGVLNDKQKGIILQVGDTILTLTGTVGKQDYGYSVQIKESDKYLLNQRLVRLRGKKNITANSFISFLVSTEKFLYYFFSNSKGGTGNQSNVSIEDIKSIRFFLPSLSEQKKIASFIRVVDEKLQTLKKKKALLEQHKKGVMQKIFSQELRFKDDNGKEFSKWENKKLNDIGKFFSGTGFTNSEQGGGSGIPFYKVSDMNLKGNHFEMLTANNYVTHEQTKRLNYKIINKPSIIFAKVGAAIFLERKRIANKFLIDNNMMAFIPIGNIYFYKYIFDTLTLSKFAQVGALPSYNSSDLSIIKLMIPSYDEQTKIANFLSAIDEKINLCTTQIEKTEQYKKGLLQKMFV